MPKTSRPADAESESGWVARPRGRRRCGFRWGGSAIARLPRSSCSWFESGLIADLDHLTGGEADQLAMWSIADARELAWDQAETLWKLRDRPDIAGQYEDALSRLVELGGRGILL
jgi:hypothetical protein